MPAQPIVKDTLSLQVASQPATKADSVAVQNLKDTLLAYDDRAAGIAANMIGVHKRIIAFFVGPLPAIMINPEIIERKDKYQAEEGCLSLTGERPATRYKSIVVKYENENFEPNEQEFTGFTAEVIQHEIDHCNGILI